MAKVTKAVEPRVVVTRGEMEKMTAATESAVAHDPQRVVEDVRDQLGAPDNTLAFLFGTGTSSGIKVRGTGHGKDPSESLIPDVKGLTERCSKVVCATNQARTSAWSCLVTQCSDAMKEPNIENILSLVQTRVEALGAGDSLSGLSKKEWENLELEIRKSIANAVQPDEAAIPSPLPHDDFASWIRHFDRKKPVELFTLNYDILLERSLERASVPLFDGFMGSYEPFFCPDTLERRELCPAVGWTHLWKIHGSVNWRAKRIGDRQLVVRTQPTKTGEMIMPSRRKYDESRKLPYTAILDHLRRTLDQDDALLVTNGYSFGDEHVNSILLTVLDNRRKANVIAFMHGEQEPDGRVVSLARGRPNFVVIGPNAGVISGVYAPWRLARPVDDGTSSFMDLAFDSRAVKPDDNKGAADPSDDALHGKMRLGSFEWFCKFLLTMIGNTRGPDGR
jgi:hypothetical protein